MSEEDEEILHKNKNKKYDTEESTDTNEFSSSNREEKQTREKEKIEYSKEIGNKLISTQAINIRDKSNKNKNNNKIEHKI